MAINTFTYAMADEALTTAQSSLGNARQWERNKTYAFGDTAIFNNSFYQCISSHQSTDTFDPSFWNKLNNDSDKIKGMTVDASAKLNGRVLAYDSATNTLVFVDKSGNTVTIDVDPYFLANSDTLVASQKAVKSYVDNKFAGIATGSAYKGVLDVTLGVTLPSDIIIGHWYRIVGNNTIGSLTLNEGDMIVANKTKSGSTLVSDWDKIDNTEAADILRTGSISTNTNLTADTGKLTDRATLKAILDALVGDKSQLPTVDKTNIVNSIKEVFQSGSNVKANVVTALSAKGSDVTTMNTWNEVVGVIGTLGPVGSSPTVSILNATKFNVTASSSVPYTKSFALTNLVVNKKIMYGVRELIPGPQSTPLVSDFNNADSTNFEYNENVVFDGAMSLKPIVISSDMTDDGVLGAGNMFEYTFDKSSFENIETVKITRSGVALPVIDIRGTHFPQTVKAIGDINLINIETLDQVIVNSSTSGGGKVLTAISFDGGVNYYVYNLGTMTWDLVDINNTADFLAKGMTKTVSDSLTKDQLDVVRNGATQLRFAYYLSVTSTASVANVDSVSVKLTAKGTTELANKADFDVLIGSDNKSVDIKFYKSGTYTMEVLDL
jgi:hypothetical protein